MQWALMFYCVATIFVVVYSVPDLCGMTVYNGINGAYCGRYDVKYAYNFIPPVSQHISFIILTGQPITHLPYNAFRNLSSQSTLSEIWIEQSQISHVDSGALLNLRNLTIIDLSHNAITQLDSKLFSDTKQITRIHLDANKIEVLPSGLFQNLLLLEQVYLNDNRIRQVEWFSFQNTPALQIIDLRNNQIELMNVSFKDTFENLKFLDLDDNPWMCNCELGPLYDILVEINQLGQSGLVCEEPATLHGRKWSDISRDEFVTVSNRTGCPLVDTSRPQTSLDQSWIVYTIIGFIIGFVIVLRCALLKLSKNRHVLLPSIQNRGSSRRTSTGNMDSGIPMSISQSRAASEDNDSATNTADVNVK